MTEFVATFRGQQEIDVAQPSSGHRWHFLVTSKGPGRRRLEGPIGVTFAAAADDELMQAARDFAHVQASKAGRIDV